MSDPILFFLAIAIAFIIYFLVRAKEITSKNPTSNKKLQANTNPSEITTTVFLKVIESIKPLIRNIQLLHGRLSPIVYLDPYVMGFLFSAISIHIGLYSGGSIRGEEAGKLLMDIARDFFDEDGINFLRQATSLEHEGTNLEFCRGVENAKKIYLVGFGLNDLQDDQEVNLVREEIAQGAYEVDTSAPNTVGNSKIAALLLQKLFFNYVLSKYGPSSDLWNPEESEIA